MTDLIVIAAGALSVIAAVAAYWPKRRPATGETKRLCAHEGAAYCIHCGLPRG